MLVPEVSFLVFNKAAFHIAATKSTSTLMIDGQGDVNTPRGFSKNKFYN